MSDFKIGEASWDEQDVSAQRPAGDRKKVPFLKMEHGKNYKVRIISKPYKYYAKWVKTAAGQNIKLNSSLTEDCPLTQDGEQPTIGWYAKVLWRDGDKTVPCVLDFGRQIKKCIEVIQNNADYGKNVHEYDVTIAKGAKGSQPLYSVTPSPPKPLTDEEKKIAIKINKKEIDGKPNADYIDLEERCKPLPVETIRKILAGETSAEGGSERAQGKGKGKAAAAAAADAAVFSGGSTEEPEEEESAPAPAPAAKAQSSSQGNKTTVAANDKDFLDF